ncbi:MAG: metalloregulator ArsR/SmtB family transcription factor [Synergistaceae bacterium]|jgi:DNA-binding transcriptional ArsR family regulator|nr:metalloregulator ArsR/SmtB family transcription factor [Synergistaceae bacterium]
MLVEMLMEKAERVAELLKIIANKNRLLILCALSEGARTVREIHDFTPDISLSALSQHLTFLRTAGLLSSEKSGQYVRYAIADERVVELLKALKKYYCDEEIS